MFLSLTLGRALGVEAAPVKTGFLAAWRDGRLKGRLEWNEVFALAGASAVAAASYLESNGDAAESRSCYQRGKQLAFAALVRLPDDAPRASRRPLETAIQMATEKLAKLEALEERDEAPTSGAKERISSIPDAPKNEHGRDETRRKSCPTPSLELCMELGRQMESNGVKSLIMLEGVLAGCSQREATRIMQTCTDYMKSE